MSTFSLSLPGDHWLYSEYEDNVPPMGLRCADPKLRRELAEIIREAAKYAIKGATMRGASRGWDPDALVQNLIVGLLGYWTDDALLNMDGMDGDPDPIPAMVVKIVRKETKK